MSAPLVAFTVPGTPPSPNTTRTRNWHQNAGEAHAWKDAAYIALHEATGGRWPRITSCRLVLVHLAATRRKRDPDNLVAACKPIIDALVVAGLLPGDDFDVVRELTVRREMAAVTGVRVEVWP